MESGAVLEQLVWVGFGNPNHANPARPRCSKLALPSVEPSTSSPPALNLRARRRSSKRSVASVSPNVPGPHLRPADGGWGYTLAGSFQNRQSYFQQDYNRAFFYRENQKALGNHAIHQRDRLAFEILPRLPAAHRHHNKDFARSLFTGSEEDYERLRGYSVAYDAIFNDGTLLQQYDSLNALHGYSSADDFEEEVSATDFIDDRPRELRRQLQRALGHAPREVLYERQNKYKPLFSLRHSGRLRRCTSPTWPTRVTATEGYATRKQPRRWRLHARRASRLPEILQLEHHRWPVGPPIDPTYSDSLLKSGRILRKLFNNHYWYGVLSTFRHETSESLTLSGGLISARTKANVR